MNRPTEKHLEVVDLEQYKEAAQGERLSVLKTYKLYIDGKFPRSESERYYQIKSSKGEHLANISRASRKDFRNAVVAARKAFTPWSERSAYNRGQILYRAAEMLEGRRAQFIAELEAQGSTKRDAEEELNISIDRLIYYAGWSDKYQQIFSTVNPVNGPYFNFSILEPTGVVSLITPEKSSLLGLVSSVAPIIVGGNSVVVLASETLPLCSVTLAEVFNSSDLPGGVVNILTGLRTELVEHFSSHMDVNAIVCCDLESAALKKAQESSALNVKRCIERKLPDWRAENAQGPYFILDTLEVKTTWHPIGL